MPKIEWPGRVRDFWWSRNEFQKFYWGFGLFFAVAMIWHFAVLTSCDERWNLAKHQLTYLIAHPFLFAPAFGLLCTVVNRRLLSQMVGWYFVLVVFLAVVIVLTVIDMIRIRGTPNFPLLGPFETGFFMLAIGGYIWYCLAAIWSKRVSDVAFVRLSAAAALSMLWIPLRVYADLAEKSNTASPLGLCSLIFNFTGMFGGTATQVGTVGVQPKFALLIALLVCSCFAMLAVVSYARVLPLQLTGSVTAALSALFSITLAADTSWFEPAHRLIDELGGEMFFALGLILFVMILSLAKSLLPDDLTYPNVDD
jgi:hypothetical protein